VKKDRTMGFSGGCSAHEKTLSTREHVTGSRGNQRDGEKGVETGTNTSHLRRGQSKGRYIAVRGKVEQRPQIKKGTTHVETPENRNQRKAAKHSK